MPRKADMSGLPTEVRLAFLSILKGRGSNADYKALQTWMGKSSVFQKIPGAQSIAGKVFRARWITARPRAPT